MKILSYDGQTFATLNVGAGVLNDLPGPDRRPVILERMGTSPISAGMSTGARAMVVEFQVKPTFTVETTILALLGALDLDNNEERVLIGQLNDGTTVQCNASIGAYTNRPSDRKSVIVTFYATDPVWRSATTSTASHVTTSLTADEGMALALTGQARTRLQLRITPTVIRATQTDDYGWKYRKTRTLVNTTAETLDRFPYRFSLGDTSALVTATKALASGNDLRVWFNGEQIPRTLVTWNTAASYVWVILDGFKAGESRTYEFLYGNAAATAPTVLAYPDLPPFNLTASDNSTWDYDVQDTTGNAGKGLWYLDRGTRSPRVIDFKVPGAWQRYRYQDNRDVVNQSSNDSYVASAITYWHGILDVQRQREGATVLQDQGLADGIIIFVPTGIIKLNADWRFQNSAEQVGTTNEVQTLAVTGTPTGGTVRLDFESEITSTIAYNASAATVKTALEALLSIGSGNVATSGGPWPGTAVVVTFQGALAGIDTSMIVLSTNSLTGGASPSMTFTETTKGQSLTAIGQAVILTRAGGGESWETVWSKAHIHNTSIDIGAADYSSGTPYPTFLYLGGLARDTEVPQETRQGAALQFKTRNVFKVYPNTTAVITDAGLSSEASIYDVFGEIAVSRGGSTENQRLYLGGKRGSGRLALPLTSGLLVDGERRAVEEWDSAFTAKIADRGYAGHVVDVRTVNSVETEFVTADWLNVQPRTSGGSNMSFASDIANWTEDFNHASATVVWTSSASVPFDANSNVLSTVSVNTAVGAIISTFLNDEVGAMACTSSDVIGLVYAVLSTNRVNLIPFGGLRWYDAAGAVISTSYDDSLTALPANATWYVRSFSAGAPSGAASVRAVLGIWSVASGATGACRFDAVSMNGNALDFGQFDTSVTIQARWMAGYLG